MLDSVCDAHTQLIDALCERQRESGLTDTAFARRLRVHRAMWRQVRLGQTLPGRKTLCGIRREFPELRDALDAFLLTAEEPRHARTPMATPAPELSPGS